MKARSRKKLRFEHYSQAKKKASQETVNVVEDSPKPCRAFELLFKELTPIQELVEDDLDILEKKPRGRPRKYFPGAEVRDDKHTYKIEDVITIKPLSQKQKLQIVEMFRFHYRVNGLPLNCALERIEQAFKIGHKQAHQILEKEF